jgi:hypothetical protein
VQCLRHTERRATVHIFFIHAHPEDEAHRGIFFALAAGAFRFHLLNRLSSFVCICVKGMHRLWSECEDVVSEYCVKYCKCTVEWTDHSKTLNPLFIIGVMFDMFKTNIVPSSLCVQEAIEAEIASATYAFQIPSTLEDLLAMLYSKGYISVDTDPIDMSALNLLSRRSVVSVDDVHATVCRVFLRNGVPKGSASRLVCDAFRSPSYLAKTRRLASTEGGNGARKKLRVWDGGQGGQGNHGGPEEYNPEQPMLGAQQYPGFGMLGKQPYQFHPAVSAPMHVPFQSQASSFSKGFVPFVQSHIQTQAKTDPLVLNVNALQNLYDSLCSSTARGNQTHF